MANEFVARNVDLDVVDTLADTQPHRFADLVGSIGNHPETFGVHVLLSLVAKAAGYCDLRARRAIAWAGEISLFDLLAHHHV